MIDEAALDAACGDYSTEGSRHAVRVAITKYLAASQPQAEAARANAELEKTVLRLLEEAKAMRAALWRVRTIGISTGAAVYLQPSDWKDRVTEFLGVIDAVLDPDSAPEPQAEAGRPDKRPDGSGLDDGVPIPESVRLDCASYVANQPQAEAARAVGMAPAIRIQMELDGLQARAEAAERALKIAMTALARYENDPLKGHIAHDAKAKIDAISGPASSAASPLASPQRQPTGE